MEKHCYAKSNADHRQHHAKDSKRSYTAFYENCDTDITCFTTRKHLVEDIGTTSEGCLNKEKFSKHNYVLDYVEIDVPGTSYSFEMRSSETVERSIQAVKNMLRDKKYFK